jgi:Asp/Glu/hydantoin racemase
LNHASGPRRRELVLVNPNTDSRVTMAMGAIARDALVDLSGEDRFEIITRTVHRGVSLITNELALSEAAQALIESLNDLHIADLAGVIIGAFGDPALAEIRAATSIPVTGLAEASMAKAAVSIDPGAHFAVVTTTPALADSIVASAWRYGHADCFAGVELTPGDPATLMADAEALEEAIYAACVRAIQKRGASALVIGGGPLAQVARALAPRLSVPVIEPIPEAVRLAVQRALVAQPPQEARE